MTGRYFDLRSTVLVVVGHALHYEELPVLFARGRQIFVQMAVEDRRAALWGMDQAGAREAVDAFVKDGLLERFLDLAWRR